MGEAGASGAFPPPTNHHPKVVSFPNTKVLFSTARSGLGWGVVLYPQAPLHAGAGGVIKKQQDLHRAAWVAAPTAMQLQQQQGLIPHCEKRIEAGGIVQ